MANDVYPWCCICRIKLYFTYSNIRGHILRSWLKNEIDSYSRTEWKQEKYIVLCDKYCMNSKIHPLKILLCALSRPIDLNFTVVTDQWPCFTVNGTEGSGRHIEVLMELSQDAYVCLSTDVPGVAESCKRQWKQTNNIVTACEEIYWKWYSIIYQWPLVLQYISVISRQYHLCMCCLEV